MYIPEYDGKKKIIIFSGAGLDAPSGVSTFRDIDGIWEKYDMDKVCNEKTWKENYELMLTFYDELRVKLSEINPNEAHIAISRIVEKYGKENVYVITQNVTDLHERAGCETLHVHGELTLMTCEKCGHSWDIGYAKYNREGCPKCGSKTEVRPKIVFFYGQAPMYKYMFRAFNSTINPDTIAVIIGTQGNVVQVKNFLWGTKCHKILCNKEPSIDIPTKGFDKVYYESIIDAMPKIEKDIESFWNK